MNKDEKHPSGISLPKMESLLAEQPENPYKNSVVAQVAKLAHNPIMDQIKATASFDQNSMLRRTRLINDLNKSLDGLDIEFLKDLRKRTHDAVFDYKRDPDGYNKLQDDLDDALRKFIATFDEFERLNSEHERKLAFKEAELELDNKQLASRLHAIAEENRIKAKYDWGEKLRHLFIKSMGTALFIALLLLVGWLVKNYEWATLPYSSLFKTIVPIPKLGV
ncbi:hypothetical protein [Vibrio mangrovi]|uniref:Uncharacterized protein n=1 Tax=Vibrio mangrovi TaxID=474394 RepID=A0A1Y6IVA1_9VIBR|nr:hypothetical protein [Vibrio mangrovi]MDW6004448.1 hypothetical protein [Vibrio mangrovi]MDW6004462.1 hypothetical protein [Vibrio mangrovi]SMS00750.1 hypothetical protein VIM7927_02019 [Vibrio mangrovi]